MNDVVSHTRDHQQNLQPAKVREHAVLVALPSLAAARALDARFDRLGEPQRFASQRQARLRRAATRVGGGDGAMRVIDLDHDPHPLDELLTSLAARGIRRLDVVGRPWQPGFARAVQSRWTGSIRWLEELDEEWLWPCQSPLGDGVHVTWADQPPSTIGTLTLATLGPGRVGAGGGVMPESGLDGTDEGERVRARWNGYWTEIGSPHLVREAALGLDPLLEARLSRPGTAPEGGPAIFAVTGLDGAGKTTHAACLADHLRARGWTVATVKLYRQGAFLQLADELSARTTRGAPLAAFRLSRVVKLMDSLRVLREVVTPLAAQCDVLVFDRYTETHQAAGWSQLGWNLTHHPFLTAFPTPRRLFHLRADPDTVLDRLDQRGARRTADEHPTGLRGYAEAYERLVGPHVVTLDARASQASNARQMAAEADRALTERRTTRKPLSDGPRPLHAAPSRTTSPIPTLLRRSPDGGLGSSIDAVRDDLRGRLGHAADGVTEGTWLEARFAQALVDLWTEAPSEASLPIAPGELARQPGMQDLVLLEELDRMISGCARWAL